MSIRGFEIDKGTVGVSTSQSEDSISGLLVNAAAIAAVEGGVTGVTQGKAYEITKVKDAEAMGITAAFNALIYRHITEFYRIAGEGTKLWIMFAPVASTIKDMIEDNAQALVVQSGGTVNRIAIGYIAAVGYAAVLIDGMEQVTREAIAPAQAFHDWSWLTDRPCNVILEGRGVNGTVAAMIDLRDITEGAAALEAPNVSIMIGQDYDFAETLTGVSQKYADIGTLLGAKAFLPVNRSVAEVETMNLSSATKKKWLTAGLSSHVKIETVDDDLSDYDAKGYIFGMSYTGVPGIRFNGDHVCGPDIVDDDGYKTIASMAEADVVNKAARLLRKKLLPKVKSTVPVDSETGLLPPGIVKYFEGLGDQAFDNMAKDGEISDGKSIVDPASNLLSGDKQLNVSFVVVPTATIGKIKGTINLKTTL